MGSLDNLIKFSSEYQPEKNGVKKGSLQRRSVIRKWLEVGELGVNEINGKTEFLSQEDLMTIAMIFKARNGDVQAYKQLMDSAYGFPTQAIEQTIEQVDFSSFTFEQIENAILKLNEPE